jgi:hypothetical protein
MSRLPITAGEAILVESLAPMYPARRSKLTGSVIKLSAPKAVTAYYIVPYKSLVGFAMSRGIPTMYFTEHRGDELLLLM